MKPHLLGLTVLVVVVVDVVSFDDATTSNNSFNPSPVMWECAPIRSNCVTSLIVVVVVGPSEGSSNVDDI